MSDDTKLPTLEQIKAVWPCISHGHDLLVCAKVCGRMVARRLNTPEGLLAYITNMDGPGVDLYYHTNPTLPWVDRKARSHEVIKWSAVLIDIDPSGKEPKTAEAAMRVYQLLERMELGGNCLAIDSGRGQQMLLLLNHADFINGDVISRRSAEGAAANFLRELGRLTCVRELDCAIDPCTSDLSRLARLPYTHNSKTGRMAKPWLVPIWVPHRTDVTEFWTRWKVADIPPPEPMAAPQDGEWALRKVLAHISGKAAQFLTSGWVSPGRRGAVFAAAASLAEAGIPESVAWDWVVRANDWCEPEPLMPGQLESPFNNGWKRGLENRATARDH